MEKEKYYMISLYMAYKTQANKQTNEQTKQKQTCKYREQSIDYQKEKGARGGRNG